jgi:hypothetical protein
MSITIDSMIDSRHWRAACQPPNRRPQVTARLIPQWNVAPDSRLIPRWTRLRLDAAGNIAFQWFVLFIALHETNVMSSARQSPVPDSTSIHAGFSQTVLPECT